MLDLFPIRIRLINLHLTSHLTCYQYVYNPLFQALQTEIERDGRLFLEAAQRELFQPETAFTKKHLEQQQDLHRSGDKPILQGDQEHQIQQNERKRRILFSLENRWTRLRFKTIEFTLQLEAAVKNKEVSF